MIPTFTRPTFAELIEWHNAATDKPDSDTTVLIIPGGELEATIGYLDGDRWRYGEGMPCDSVIWWAHLPTGPEPD